MRKYLNLIIVFLILCFSYAFAQELSEPEKNFECLWNAFDRNYGIFGPKKVDWRALYSVYRLKVTPRTTDDELFEIMSNMLGHLNDNHVRLTSQSPSRVFIGGILNEIYKDNFGDITKARQFMSQRPINNKYLQSKLEERMNNIFAFGWITDDIGYFHFNSFGNISQSTAVIDEIINEFRNAKGIIVDVRRNFGGDDRVGKLIADRFADRKRLYMITYTRNGPNYDDFTPPKYWYVEPDGPHQFTKPVVILINRFSISAAENFALAMRVLPHVTLVGDLTSGVFADVYSDVLPNGWSFRVPYKLFVDYAGFCWEGIGVPPDLRIINTKEDVQRGKDSVLELAIALLDSSSLKLQDESGSLQNIRESLAKTLKVNIEQRGIAFALKEFREAKKGSPETYYVDAEEMDALGNEMMQAGKKEEALEVFKLNSNEHPDMWMPYKRLGQMYSLFGNVKEGSENFEKAAKLNPRSYPWEREAVYTLQLEQSLFSKGFRSVKDKFIDLKKNYPDFAQIAERAMNRFGYDLLRINKVKEAIEIFKINVEAFPESWNVYDSLGEAYMVNGDRILAIKNYEKSIQLNPDNINGKNMLKRLKEK